MTPHQTVSTEQTPAVSGRRTGTGRRGDTIVCLAYLALAGCLTYGLWRDPAGHALAYNWQDQTLNEWFLANGVLFWQGDGALVSDRLNAPDGVNLMANASLLLLGVVFAPVTALFGAPMSFVLAVTVALAGTASGWFLLLRRQFGLGRLAAVVGGGFCGFAPGMVSQANGHPHIAAQYAVPLMVFLVVRLFRGRRPVLTGAVLGVVVALQLLHGEEVLFLTAVACALFVIWYAVLDRRDAVRRLAPTARGLGATAVVGGVLAGYPLWVQFAGPQSVPNGVFAASYFYADVTSYPHYPGLSLAGDMSAANQLTTSASEQNSYFGWPLLLLVGWAFGWLWRRSEVRALALTAGCCALLSLGPEITVGGELTGLPGPWHVIGHLPVVDAALPTRFALPLIPIFGIVLALAADQARQWPGSHTRPASLRRWPRWTVEPGHETRLTCLMKRVHCRSSAPPLGTVAARWRGVVAVGFVAGLLPLFPTPLPVIERPVVPRFVSSGEWRACVPPGGTLVPAPLPSSADPTAMGWAAAARNEFALPQGFFIGPYAPGGNASIGTYPQPTAMLLERVAVTGAVPTVGARERDQARADLRFWRAECVVVAVGTDHANRLRLTLDRLLERPGKRVADVWMWDL